MEESSIRKIEQTLRQQHEDNSVLLLNGVNERELSGSKVRGIILCTPFRKFFINIYTIIT